MCAPDRTRARLCRFHSEAEKEPACRWESKKCAQNWQILEPLLKTSQRLLVFLIGARTLKFHCIDFKRKTNLVAVRLSVAFLTIRRALTPYPIGLCGNQCIFAFVLKMYSFLVLKSKCCLSFRKNWNRYFYVLFDFSFSRAYLLSKRENVASREHKTTFWHIRK